jgi:hypothetical protein
VDTHGRVGPLMKTATVYSNDRVNPVRSVSVILNIALPQ